MGGGPKPAKTENSASPYAPWLKDELQRLVSAGSEYAYGGRGGEPFGFGGLDAEGNSVTQNYLDRTSSRFADFDPFQKQAQQAAGDMYDRGDMYSDQRRGAANSAMGGLSNMQAIQSTYGPTQFQGGEFNQAAAEKYMSPYMQNVVDAQKMAARDEYAMQQNLTDAERISGGAMGGYRAAVDDAVSRSQQGRVMADIQARGSESAYTDAQGMFDRDRRARLEAEGMGDESRYQASQQMFSAAQENEANKLRQAQAYSQMSNLWGEMDAQEQAREFARMDRMAAAGSQRSQMEQSKLDLANQTYMDEFMYPRDQMSWLSGILAGVPTQANAQSTTNTPQPSYLQQGLGAATALGGAALAGRR
tara:strand:- start:1857 stop:2939 length:1083 start_codon:yes stop_codon:yes gene_type:complete